MSSERVSPRLRAVRILRPVPIAVTVRGDELGSARELARSLEAAADDIEVVAVVAGAAEAQRAVSHHVPDVVVLDVDGPADRVADEAAYLRALSPTTRAVVIAPSGGAGDAAASVVFAGAWASVERSVPAESIAASVRSVSARRTEITPATARELIERLPHLSEAERDVLAGAADGETPHDIALRLGVPSRLVRRRLEDVVAKAHIATFLGRGRSTG